MFSVSKAKHASCTGPTHVMEEEEGGKQASCLVAIAMEFPQVLASTGNITYYHDVMSI